MTGPGTTASGPSAHHGAQGWQPLYLLAGVGALLFVFLLVAALGLDLLAPPPVHGGEATLLFIAANKPGYVAEQILWILPDILPVLVFAALFVALFTVRKSLALTALVFGGLPSALLLALPVSSRGSLNLVYLSDRYVAAAEVLRHVLPEFYGGYGVLLWAWFAATGIALVRLSRSAPLAPAGRRIRDFGP